MEKQSKGARISERCKNLCKKAWRQKGMLTIFGVLLILAILITAIATSRNNVEHKSRTVRFAMEAAGELVTQKAYCTNVQVIRNSREVFGITVPFTQSQYIFSYDGVVEACLDFSKVEFSVSDSTITVRVPPVYIRSSNIIQDSLEVYDESKNIFTPLKLADVNASIEEWQIEAEKTAVANGILVDAMENAKTLLTAFLAGGYDLTQYQIEWIITE